MTSLMAWLGLAASLVAVGGYELRAVLRGRRDPHATARSVHSVLRAQWVAALAAQAGSEIVAVQTLRNSLMSATISASTAALALMGTLTFTAPVLADSATELGLRGLTVRTVLELLLLSTLFASYVCSAMAMRFYNHAGFALSLPVGSQARERWAPVALDHLQRAGLLYSWGLRCFMFVAPIVAGLFNAMLMLPATLVLVAVLSRFDRAPGLRSPGP